MSVTVMMMTSVSFIVCFVNVHVCLYIFIFYNFFSFFSFFYLFFIIFCIFLCSLLLFLFRVCVVLSVRFYNK